MWRDREDAGMTCPYCHGENKPGLSVGTGRGDLHVPDEYLDELESRRP